MRENRFRCVALGLPVACFLLGLVECGGTNDSRSTAGQGSSGAPDLGGAGGSSGAAASGASACEVPSAAGYEPTWTPPRAPLAGVCTEQQVAMEWNFCENSSALFDVQACRAFDVDPANAACLGCLFGALGATDLGAVLVLPEGQWIANRAGCIALVDGDSSATGCGAKTQAADVCQYTACLAACTAPVSNADFAACEKTARNGACRAYVDQAACSQLPRYASCSYSDFSEYYRAMADLFCPSEPGGAAEGGAAGASP